jgi:predicted RNA-binding Zn-ribbon protein involved in translation (DUF1610 family)
LILAVGACRVAADNRQHGDPMGHAPVALEHQMNAFVVIAKVACNGGYYDTCPTGDADTWSEFCEAEKAGIVARYIDEPWCVCWMLSEASLAGLSEDLKGKIRTVPPKPITGQTAPYKSQKGYHLHECHFCGTFWEHEDKHDTSADKIARPKAHACPNCGELQLIRYQGPRAPDTTTRPTWVPSATDPPT